MAAVCDDAACVCGRLARCATLKHSPLVWTDAFGSATAWHLKTLSAVGALGGESNRNLVLCGIELVIEGMPLRFPAIGNIPCIFVSGKPPGKRTSLSTLERVADAHALGAYTARYAYQGCSAARIRARQLLSGLTDAHVGAPPPQTAVDAVDTCTGCDRAVYDKGAHSEHDLLALTDEPAITCSLNAALNCLNPAEGSASRGAPHSFIKRRVTALNLHVASYRYTCGVCGLCYRAAPFSPAPLLATAWRILTSHKAVRDPEYAFLELPETPSHRILVSAVKPFEKEPHVAIADAPGAGQTLVIYASKTTLTAAAEGR